MGRLFHVFIPVPMKMLVLVLVKGRLLDVTPILGQDDIADLCMGWCLSCWAVNISWSNLPFVRKKCETKLLYLMLQLQVCPRGRGNWIKSPLSKALNPTPSLIIYLLQAFSNKTQSVYVYVVGGRKTSFWNLKAEQEVKPYELELDNL